MYSEEKLNCLMLLLSSKSYWNSEKPKVSTVFNLVDLHLQTAIVNYENQNLSYYFSCLNVRTECVSNTLTVSSVKMCIEVTGQYVSEPDNFPVVVLTLHRI